MLIAIQLKKCKTPHVVGEALAPVLENFIEMVPTELPRWLPSRCEVDHTVELVLSAKPPTKALCQMAFVELKELQR